MLKKTDLSKICPGDIVMEKDGNTFYFHQNTDHYKHKTGFIYTPGDMSFEAKRDNSHIVAIIEFGIGYEDPIVHFSEDSVICMMAENEVISAMRGSDSLESAAQ
ncbi:hypothetical protein D3C72_1907320 [compost metagenome]